MYQTESMHEILYTLFFCMPSYSCPALQELNKEFTAILLYKFLILTIIPMKERDGQRGAYREYVRT